MKNELTLASPQRLEALLKETEEELLQIQPRLEALEEYVRELQELKLSKQRLLTLKMSLSALLDTMTKDLVSEVLVSSAEVNSQILDFKNTPFLELSASKMFDPDAAFKAADKLLKQKQSLNYEMFKAVVFNGGKASTEEIKAFLVESGARQPQSGEGFENAPLTEISSRANYLVRKGVLHSLGKGHFCSTVGWVTPEG